MIKKLINSFGENDYASPRATLVEIEPITNILICSLDGDSGTEAVSDSEDSFGL